MSIITEKARTEIREQTEYLSKISALANKMTDCEKADKNILFTSEEIDVVERALACHAAVIQIDVGQREEALECGSEDGNLQSHSEKHILEGCIGLMHGMVEEIQGWLLSNDINPNKIDGEFQHFCLEMPYTKIVKRLFLWHTTHSGGTSTAAKVRGLGIEKEYEVFEFDPDLNADNFYE